MGRTVMVLGAIVGALGAAAGCGNASGGVSAGTPHDAATDAMTGPGCGAVLAQAIPSPVGYIFPSGNLVVDGEAAYWMDAGQNVRRVPKNGGSALSLTNHAPTLGPDLTAIAVSTDAVYFGQVLEGIGHIQRVPKAGGDVTTVAMTEPNMDGLVVDSTSVYWITRVTGGTNLWRAPLDGGTPTLLSSMLYLDPRFQVIYIAVDDTSLYATTGSDFGAGSAAVYRITKDGSAVTKIADGVDTPWQLTAADPDFLYFGLGGLGSNPTTHDIHIGKIARVPKNATGPVEPTIIATDQVDPKQIVLDGGNVYWINFGEQMPDTSTIDSTIMRLAVPPAAQDAGSPASPTVVGDCQWGSQSLAVDDTGIYYIDWQGSVRVLDK